MKRDELKKILPHREPMLLLDEAEVIDASLTDESPSRATSFSFRAISPATPSFPA